MVIHLTLYGKLVTELRKTISYFKVIREKLYHTFKVIGGHHCKVSQLSTDFHLYILTCFEEIAISINHGAL